MTAAVRPDPPVPADLDLRSLSWFPLYHRRLERSAWWMRASDLAARRNVDLWVEAYQQVPAGSLPSDETQLARYAGFGRDTEGWNRHRAEIMEPWVLCSDGRFYHPVLCEIAAEAWAKTDKTRTRERNKQRTRRAKKADQAEGANRAEAPGPAEPSPGDKPDVAPAKKSDVPGGQRHTLQDTTGQKTKGSEEERKTEGAPPKASPAGSKGKRLRMDWLPSDINRTYANERGFDNRQVDEIAEAFVDWWLQAPGAKGVKADWDATWRTWIRTQARRAGHGTGTRAGAFGGAGPAGRSERDDRLGNLRAGTMEALNRRRGPAGRDPADPDQSDPPLAPPGRKP